MKSAALWLIRMYQATLSAYWPTSCRHTPTCSHYSHQAIQRHGLLKGSWLTAKRLVRCRPGGSQGYDPVP